MKTNRILLSVFYFFFVLIDFAISKNDKILRISFLTSRSIHGGKLYGGAFYRAVDDANNDKKILPGYKLEPFFVDIKSDILKTVDCMTEHYGNGTVAFVGPDGSCGIAATMAAAWNIPMIVYKCHDSKLSDDPFLEKRLRQTFVRTQPSTAKVSKSITSLLLHFHWHQICLITSNDTAWNQTSESLLYLTKENNIKIRQLETYNEPYPGDVDMSQIVEKTFRNTRIYVFLGDYHALIDFARALHKKPKDKGEYAVITVMKEKPDSIKKHFLKTPFENNVKLQEEHWMPFRSVLALSPRTPSNTNWTEFIQDVRERNMLPPINLPRPPPGINIKQVVPVSAAYLYDAVMVYVRALTDVISKGESISNGRAVVRRIQKNMYKSIQGFDVYVNEVGDAEGNYSLLSLNRRDNGTPYLGPVGCFERKTGDLGMPEFALSREIDWPSGEVPLDEPHCGFDGEKCQYEPDWRTATICSVIAAAVCVGMVFICRHYLYEQKLARLLWKLEYKDLIFVDTVEEIISPSKPKKRSSDYFPTLLPKYYNFVMRRSRGDLIKRKSQSSWRFLIDGDDSSRSTLLGNTKCDKKAYTADMKVVRIGSYKGTIVSVKRLASKNLDINRSLKKQLQQRKELNHDNINRFIGVCVETPHLYIVTQYCARGSLKDILKNPDLHIDDMFIASLVADLVKGMIFIQESEIGVHGNLKSSNCLVDSRWVLQIADFGLNQLISKDVTTKLEDVRRHEDLLWTAPEFLKPKCNNYNGTQKGDVYSFAIILYEIHGQNGPWGRVRLTPTEIIERLSCSHNGEPFRPDLRELSCEDFIKQCIMECWHECQDLRPDFKYIRYRLKPMQQGLKSNIFDNMLAIMEKYANNLEALVAERTEQLSEEKQMTENLLFRMLPRPIANQLKRGQFVSPESYECVTMYFSDIVGFTALSAESTPMQVIDMLNELYTCFDSIIAHYDVYKVETIGDAYLVVSGLPIRNGDNHAGEIASMSLRLLSAILSFKIKHRPDDTLKLRIGIHSGPVVAGVVGLRMPRYTLFGDTVNTASRMETNGLPLKIHCSSAFKCILDKLGGYTLSDRGYIAMKGKGDQFTYFLESEDTSYRQKRLEELEKTAQSFSNQSDHHKSPCGKCSFRLDLDSYNSCNGVSYMCGHCVKKIAERNNSTFPMCNTNDVSFESDFRQNLENNNTRTHSNSFDFWRENEVKVPLLNKKRDLKVNEERILLSESVL